MVPKWYYLLLVNIHIYVLWLSSTTHDRNILTQHSSSQLWNLKPNLRWCVRWWYSIQDGSVKELTGILLFLYFCTLVYRRIHNHRWTASLYTDVWLIAILNRWTVHYCPWALSEPFWRNFAATSDRIRRHITMRLEIVTFRKEKRGCSHLQAQVLG